MHPSCKQKKNYLHFMLLFLQQLNLNLNFILKMWKNSIYKIQSKQSYSEETVCESRLDKKIEIYFILFLLSFCYEIFIQFEVWYKGMEKESKSWINTKFSLYWFPFLASRYRCYKNLITFDCTYFPLAQLLWPVLTVLLAVEFLYGKMEIK